MLLKKYLLIITTLVFASSLYKSVFTVNGINLNISNVAYLTLLCSSLLVLFYKLPIITETILVSILSLLYAHFFPSSAQQIFQTMNYAQASHIILILLALSTLTIATSLSLKNLIFSINIKTGKILKPYNKSLEQISSITFIFMLFGFLFLTLAIYVSLIGQNYAFFIQYKSKIIISAIGWITWLLLILTYKKINWRFKLIISIYCLILMLLTCAYYYYTHQVIDI